MKRHSDPLQRGQAIVLVALVMVVMVGFMGLAMDGGRGYLDRREMQAAVDAGALAAAYSCMNNTNCLKSGFFTDAENAAVAVFGNNERLYSTPSCSGIGSTAVSCSFGDPTGQALTISVSTRGIAGVLFTVRATHSVPVMIMQVLGSGPAMAIAAVASAVSRRPDAGAAIQTLAPDGCPGYNGDSLRFTGTSTALLNGDVWSNGDINDNNNAGGTVSGNVIDVCPAIGPLPLPPPNWTVSGVQANGTTLPDPGFSQPSLSSTTQTWGGSSGYNVVNLPGTYGANVSITGGCWFLAGGVYDFAAGFKNTGGFVSNELRPPDEPVYNNNTARATYQFWDENLSGYGLGTGSNKDQCSGEFMPYAVGSDSSNPPLNPATYGVELTSVRWGPGNCGPPASPTCFLRESPPSMCKTVSLNSNQVLKVWVSNVAGAMSYNVYLAPGGSCSGPFGYAGQFGVISPAEQNKTVSGCNPSLAGLTSPPSLSSCDLGYSSITINGGSSCAGMTPVTNAAQDTCGAPPPDGEGGPIGAGQPNANPSNLPDPAGSTCNTPFPTHCGDLANESYCVSSTGTAVKCGAGTTTPGAVALYIPGPGSNTQCLNLQGGGSDYLYTGYQLGRILLFEPGALQSPPANSCTNNVTGGNLTSLLGIFYLPAASITIAGNSTYAAIIAGGVIAWTATIQGSGGVAITADQTLKFPGAVQLVQ